MKQNHELKRQLIENEIHSIVMADKRAILLDNLRRRKKRLGNLKLGDTVLLFEYMGRKKHASSDENDTLYRITEGKVIQVTKSGFFLDGLNGRGHKTMEFVNKAHIISGRVQLLLKEKNV